MPELRNKIIAVPIDKGIGEKTAKGTLITRGYFTSDQKDEVGDIITREATEKAIPKYRRWGNIRRMHLPEPVARVRRIGAEDGLAWNEVEIEVIDPKAIFEVENGLLQALSVGILVDPDKIEPIDKADPWSGFVIHEYALAEISLVDHPANYDASLIRGLPVEDTLRLMVRQYGLNAVAGSMAKFLEVKMEDNIELEKDAAPEEASTPEPEAPVVADAKATPPCREAGEGEEDCIDRKVSDILAENPDMARDQAAQIAAEMCASECPEDEIPAADDPVDISSDADADDEKSTDAEPEADAADTEPAADDVFVELRQVVADLRSLYNDLSEALKALETPAEAPVAEEQAGGDELSAEPEVEKDLDEPEEPGDPVNRKALFPQAGEPDTEKSQAAEPVADLRQALRRYFSNR